MDSAAYPGSFEQRIEAVRRFNRFYTRLIGLLGVHILRSRFTLTEARVLFELASRPLPAASELARDLGLDPGYLSRILARFERDDLLERQPGADRRRALLRLSEAGEAAFRTMDAGARLQVGHLLEPLPEWAQGELVRALRLVERRLGTARPAAQPLLRSHRPGDIGWVIARHGAIYAEEYGFDATFEAFVAEVASGFLKAHDPAREHCWVAEIDGVPAGSVMLVRDTDELAKLRLLIVDPNARGAGVGRALVGACVDFARAAGYRRVTLWTHDILHAARHLYRQAGFTLVRSEPHRSWGCDLMGEYWELGLA